MLPPWFKQVAGMSLHDDIRKEIGKNLKDAIEKHTYENALRKIDALTGKDHSWIGKVFNGKMNLTIDSLITLILAYKLDLKAIFNFDIDYSKITDEEIFEYLVSIQKRKPKIKKDSKALTAKNKTSKLQGKILRETKK